MTLNPLKALLRWLDQCLVARILRGCGKFWFIHWKWIITTGLMACGLMVACFSYIKPKQSISEQQFRAADNPLSLLRPAERDVFLDWIPIPGSSPIMGGQLSLSIRPFSRSFVWLAVAGDVSWVGYEKQKSLQVEAGERRFFDFQGERYAVDILALESNKAQCAISWLPAKTQ